MTARAGEGRLARMPAHRDPGPIPPATAQQACRMMERLLVEQDREFAEAAGEPAPNVVYKVTFDHQKAVGADEGPGRRPEGREKEGTR